MTLIGISIASLMMGVRYAFTLSPRMMLLTRYNYSVIALYHGNKVVPVVMVFLFLAMVGVNAWLLTAGERELTCSLNSGN